MSRKNYEALFSKYGLTFLREGDLIFEIGPERQLTIKSIIDRHLNKNYHYYFTNLSEEEMQKIINGEFEKERPHRWTRRTDINPEGWITCINEYKYDVADNSFDVVFSGNVSEHVKELWTWMAEQFRILKPGGHVICHNPFSEPYHEEPIDCWRIYPSGMRALMEWAGFEVIGAGLEHLVPEEDGMTHTETFAVGKKPTK